MNKLTKTILLITAIAIFSTGFLVSAVQAAGLAVEFEGGSPLFNKTNFVPGDIATKWVKVTNTSGSTQRIAIEAMNFTKPVPDNDLSRALMIVIKQGETEIYGGVGSEKTLYQFYQNGETYLSELTNNNTAQYDITISFPSDKEDYWQNKTTGFDVVVGFEGTEGGLPLPPPGGGASSGGGGALPQGLTISNTTETTTTETSVTITWTTSYFSTSQVIYALATESHNLDLSDNSGTPPHYGYTRTTLETDVSPKVISHSVTITGLSPATVYYYRTVSHGSLAISQEYAFITKGIAGATTEEPSITTEENQEGFVGLGQENIPGSEASLPEPSSIPESSGIIPEETPFSPIASESPAASDSPITVTDESPSPFLASIGSFVTLGTGNNIIGVIIILAIGLIIYFAYSYFLKKKKR